MGLIAFSTGSLVYLYRQLPDIESLHQEKLEHPLEIYTHDGKLIAQYGPKKSILKPIREIPRPLRLAFLAAEDDRFYQHIGIDWQGLLRAVWVLIKTGEKSQGGSTITMQLARMLFLSPKKTFQRKIKEILLAFRLEHRFSKDQILELYLNRVFLGHHAYGVAAAAKVYYGKELGQLTLAEMAMIAGLPKAPSRYNPLTNPERAKIRRNYVLRRMYELSWISEAQYREAVSAPVTAKRHRINEVEAPYVAEMVRHELYRQFGEEIYRRGFRVYTTVDSRLQELANQALREALHQYDERYGYRGVEHRFPKLPQSKEEQLTLLEKIDPVGATLPALVLRIQGHRLEVLLDNGEKVSLSQKDVAWATRSQSIPRLFRSGDLIRVRRVGETWRLAQVPQVEGALVAVDGQQGRILALVGGYDFRKNQFNRAVQAERQMGSSFKPILYTAALESGFTLATVINDAPLTHHRDWNPQNFTKKFYGPTRLRVALRHSRNIVSIKLLEAIGIPAVVETAKRFGFDPEKLPRVPSLALGTAAVSPLQMARAYSVFANGGWLIKPYLIEQIETIDGKVLWQAQPQMACLGCLNAAPRAISPRIHYLMHSALQDVIRRGTAARAGQEIERRDIAGKTGTTNDYRDAWFNGYGGGITTITWVGFDDYRSLGRGETGGRAALPMWIAFMKEALKGLPEKEFLLPEGIVTVQIDPQTGRQVHYGGISEIFREELAPSFGGVGKRDSSEEINLEEALF